MRLPASAIQLLAIYSILVSRNSRLQNGPVTSSKECAASLRKLCLLRCLGLAIP
jgi:hypothetical protein